MPPSTLALDAIREQRLAIEHLSESKLTVPLTRRQFLGSSAGTLATAALPLRDLPLTITASASLAIVRLGSVEAWRIDATRFAGRPHLTVDETPRRIHILLTDARFPGTNLSAELDCDCRRSSSGWWMRLRLGAFEGTASFERWLRGEERLVATTAASGELLRGGGRQIALESVGVQEMSFVPEWVVRFDGAPLEFVVAGREQTCAAVEVALADPAVRSVLQAPDETRSAIRVLRGDRDWSLLPPVQHIGGGTLLSSGQPFESASIDASESRSGHVQLAVAARSNGEDKFSFQPGQGLLAVDRTPIALPLRDVDYAVTGDGGGETALLASFGRAPQWIQAAGAAIRVGDAGDRPAFEIVKSGDEDVSLLCAPRLLASLIPLEGVLTEALAPRTMMQIALAGTPPAGSAALAPCSSGEGLELCVPDCCVAVTRPKDLLALCFEFRNLSLRKHPFRKATLRRCTEGDAYVIVHFPPQHIAEEALPEDTTTAAPSDVRPVASRAARPSRLAFRLKPGTDEIDYTLESLLNWRQFDAAVVPLERHWRHISEPQATETSIEFPYRIKLSPEEGARWIHSAKAVEHDGRIELWHTRLTVDGPDPVHVAAVWSPDYVPGPKRPDPDDPFVMSVSNTDRHDIIVANHDSASCPEPIPAPLLMLSSLGAWSDLKGEWKEQTGRCFGTSLEKWEHQATMGRDQHVVIARRGFLYPFGHRAVLIKETERRVHPVSGAGGTISFIAYLRLRQYIVLREPVKNYAADPMLSFDQVEFLDHRSPMLDLVIVNNVPFPAGGVPKCSSAGNWLAEVFWPTVKGKPYRFRLAAIDKAQNRIKLDAPVIFVENDPSFLAIYRESASCAYRDGANLPHRTSILEGQKVGISASLEKGDTEIDASNVVFIGDDDAPEEPSGFKPHIDTFSGRVPALEQFVAGGGGGTTLRLRDPDATTAQIYAEIVRDKPAASFSSTSDRSGGVAAPSVNVTHLSRRFGPVGLDTTTPVAPSSAAADIDTFNPQHFFGDDANILGQISLKDVVADMAAASLDAVPAIRALLTEWRDGPSQLVQTISWATSLKELPAGPFTFTPRGQLVLDGTFEAWLGTDIKPRFRMTGTLNDFTIKLDFGAVGVALNFNRLVFTASSEGSTDVDPDIAGVDFLGALKFVQDLAKKFTAPAGFNITLRPGSVMVQAPPINLGKLSVGAFAFENLSITSWVALPFTRSPVEFGFAVARPDKPFLVTVGVYSGGGHFAITLDSSGNGIRHLRAAIEFGAQKEISFGSVAHGRLYVFGGLYYEQTGPVMTFRAYVRAGGEIEALGLISMGVELYLALDYVTPPGDLLGTARMTYSFSIGFVKKSFSITYQQRFAGSGSSTKSARLRPAGEGGALVLGAAMQLDGEPAPPVDEGQRVTMADTLDEDRWTAYWKAFAS